MDNLGTYKPDGKAFGTYERANTNIVNHHSRPLGVCEQGAGMDGKDRDING